MDSQLLIRQLPLLPLGSEVHTPHSLRNVSFDVGSKIKVSYRNVV